MTEQYTIPQIAEMEEADFAGIEQLEFVDFKQKYVTFNTSQFINFLKSFQIYFLFRLLAGKKLFKDPNFPPNDASFSQTKAVKVPSNMKWMRASEISKNPKFLGGAVTRFDVNQGKLKISKNNDKY